MSCEGKSHLYKTQIGRVYRTFKTSKKRKAKKHNYETSWVAMFSKIIFSAVVRVPEPYYDFFLCVISWGSKSLENK